MIKLHTGDVLHCLAKMPDNSVDIVVTSPPYNHLTPRTMACGGMHKTSGWVLKVNRIGYADSKPEAEYQTWLQDVVRECLRVSKGLVWLNHKVRYRDGAAIHPARFLDFPIWSEVIWARAGSMALNSRRFGHSHEMILGFGRPHWWDNNSNRIMSVWKIHQVQNRTDHPCPFPEELPRRLIEASCPPGGLVLDPFAGSGTVGLVCKQLGRDFIGIDLNPSYTRMARKRIAAAQVLNDRPEPLGVSSCPTPSYPLYRPTPA